MVTRGVMGTALPDINKKDEPNAFDEEWGGIFTEKRSKWSEQRAVIVKKPETPIVAEIGQFVFIPVEVLNQTKWPWKQGC